MVARAEKAVVAKIVTGDCREAAVLADLVFADPPFNIGHGYTGYNDRRADFEVFTEQWIDRAWECCRGVMCLHGPDDLAEMYLLAQRRLGAKRIAWINWHYRFGQCGRSNWIDARCHCLVFAKSESWTWNPEDVLVPSDRAAKYGDRRVADYDRGGERLPGTVWGVPSDGPYWGRVQGNSKERWAGHPNQLPEVYLARLLRAYTNPGDMVLDMFCGSGTMPVVAAALGRQCVSYEISEASAESARRRVQRGATRV